MNGLDASQGNYALADGSVVQGTGVDLSSAIQAPHSDGGGVLTEKNAASSTPDDEGSIMRSLVDGVHKSHRSCLSTALPRD